MEVATTRGIFPAAMRAIFVSQAYSEPGTRGKLRALCGLDCAVAAAVPAGPARRTGGAAYGDDAGVLVAPVATRQTATGRRWDARALRRLFAEFRPDLIQLEEPPTSPGAVTVSRAARHLGIPLVLFTGESVAHSITITERIRRHSVLRSVRGVMAENQVAGALIERVRPALHAVVVPQLGVAVPPQQSPLASAEFMIGFFGRLVPERGVDLLLRACVHLAGSWRLELVGTGPAQEELESLAARLGIAARVTWHGALPHEALLDVWRKLHCVVLPSRSTPHWVEPVGRAALEGMARSVPVVATRSGALPDVVGSAGLLVPEDDVPALTGALQELHDDAALRGILGAEGRRRVLSQFSDEAVARRTLAFWRSLLTESP
ncbi:MAG TPA: glycosyltransferase [Gemmatimonadales bacterium]|nr:glycosyltransferase [Gemmatimonadales bacterium]